MKEIEHTVYAHHYKYRKTPTADILICSICFEEKRISSLS
ncbi:hypothetical protein HMPREF0742_00658 [Rothia aeria F0184]|uniref:Uncharacterized protein n=1 Tax=Rothia aeria F0184 TaxID=888019 RepID=U7V8D7_9MICC|nr:hypothetical protein HMPREF0742_00658 [Rothia aeria F0184]